MHYRLLFTTTYKPGLTAKQKHRIDATVLQSQAKMFFKLTTFRASFFFHFGHNNNRTAIEIVQDSELFSLCACRSHCKADKFRKTIHEWTIMFLSSTMEIYFCAECVQTPTKAATAKLLRLREEKKKNDSNIHCWSQIILKR